jgi:hypothetical protein
VATPPVPRLVVTPAQAGFQRLAACLHESGKHWIPAFAGMTGGWGITA